MPLTENTEPLSFYHNAIFLSAIPARSARDILESYTLDAIDWYDPDKDHKALKSEATRFQKSALSAGAEGRPSVGLGTDFRLESKKVAGFALALDDQILHVSIFARAEGRDRQAADSRIERFSGRRRNRRV